MAQSIKGLRLKPKYEDLIGVAVSDKLYSIKFLNRDAQFLRHGFVLSQLDGEGARLMEKQQEVASKEAYKEHRSKQIAKNTGSNINDLRNDAHQELRTERVNNAMYFNMAQGDDDMESQYSLQSSSMGVTQTNESGVQANSGPTTNSSGSQTSSGPETRSFSSQTNSGPTTRPFSSQASTRMYSSSTQTTHRESRATEDRSNEIARLQAIHEQERQALLASHQANLESTRNQLIEQLRSEAESAHSQRTEEHRQEALQQIRITQTEAERLLNQQGIQAQQEARQEVQQVAGRITEIAEVQHRNIIAQQKAKTDQAEQRQKKHRKLTSQY